MAWASAQEGFASEGIKVATLKKRVKELVLAGYVEFVDKKKTMARLTSVGRERLSSYLEKARNANKFFLAKRQLAGFAGQREKETKSR